VAALAPDQPPDAIQDVAWAADQVSMELLPLATVLGPADKVTVGAGVDTETVADWVALPPLPVQLRM
jgi:hypothetical protein